MLLGLPGDTALLQTVLDTLNVGVYVIDRGRLSYVNRKFVETSGYTREELLSLDSIEPLIVEEDRPVLHDVMARRLSGDPGPSRYVIRIRCRDGEALATEVRSSVALVRGRLVIVGAAVDVPSQESETRRTRERNDEQMNRLTSVGRLAAQVAHEFNNVLMGIQPLVDIVRRRSDDPKLASLAELVAGTIKRGKRITTDILRFGRPAQPALRPVAADELLRQVCDELQPMLPAGIELEVSVAGEPPAVMADRAQLAQVLVNLALNACDAMERRHSGTIRLRVAHCGDTGDGPRVQFSVIDTGDGIAREDLPYIFEPLFTTKRSGTGLGLPVVFQIVTLHGGQVWVDSEPGKGSAFHLVIPAAATAVPGRDHAGDAEIVGSEPGLSPRVLVVEDDETVAIGLQWALEAAGITMFAVGRGSDVRPAVQTFRPDVIVLDVDLPDANGVTVYEELSAEYPIPVVFSSGQASDPRTQAMVDERRAAYLEKPYRVSELLEAIRQLLE